MALFAICQIVLYSKLRLQHVPNCICWWSLLVSPALQGPCGGWQLLWVLVQGSWSLGMGMVSACPSFLQTSHGKKFLVTEYRRSLGGWQKSGGCDFLLSWIGEHVIHLPLAQALALYRLVRESQLMILFLNTVHHIKVVLTALGRTFTFHKTNIYHEYS